MVDCDDITPVSDVTYVDDLRLMVAAEKPDELIGDDQVCRRALAKHGSQMNFSKGKLSANCGPLEMAHRDLMACLQYIDDQRVITVDDVVRVVRSCRHLGTIHTATGNMTEEARARVKAMMAAYRALAGRVFGSPKLSRRTRLRLADTLLWCILLFATGTWSLYTPTVLRCFNTVYMRVLRKCAGRCPWSREPYHRHRSPHGVASAWDTDTAPS